MVFFFLSNLDLPWLLNEGVVVLVNQPATSLMDDHKSPDMALILMPDSIRRGVGAHLADHGHYGGVPGSESD